VNSGPASRVLNRRFSKEIISLAFALPVAWILFPADLVQEARAQSPTEYQVKAVFLYNFAKFVDWPQPVGNASLDPFVIGVLGDDPFGNVLDQALLGKSVNGRPLRVRRFKRAEDAKACQIVFISSSEGKHLQFILQSLKGTSVLTVGDTKGFADLGGVINFILEDDRVHFEINVDAAESAGLKISSKLLSLAKVVRTKGSGGKG
jgi:uncharacterized protein DUF4154